MKKIRDGKVDQILSVRLDGHWTSFTQTIFLLKSIEQPYSKFVTILLSANVSFNQWSFGHYRTGFTSEIHDIYQRLSQGNFFCPALPWSPVRSCTGKNLSHLPCSTRQDRSNATGKYSIWYRLSTLPKVLPLYRSMLSTEEIFTDGQIYRNSGGY